MRKFWRKR